MISGVFKKNGSMAIKALLKTVDLVNFSLKSSSEQKPYRFEN
jgi:hypothetical protein